MVHVLQSEWCRDLLESDRRYFEAGGETIPVRGAVIARLQGIEALPAGCVVQRVDPEAGAPRPDRWVAEVEERLRTFGCVQARVYLDAPNTPVQEALVARGYRPRVEVGFVRGCLRETNPAIELKTAEEEIDWQERRLLIARLRRGPDGHEVDPDSWVEMERRKHKAGFLRPLRIIVGGVTAGVVSAARAGTILRLKNLVVDPDYQRRGIGTAAALQFAKLAADGGYEGVGAFALAGARGMSAYANAGYHAATLQTEWIRNLKETS